MSMSEFRRKKLSYVFNTFFDVNKSGSIDKKDVDLAIQSICGSRGWGPDSPKLQSIKSILLKVWDGLMQGADTDNDGQISVDEWYSLWDNYAKDPKNAPEWQQLYMNLAFELQDSSGDGSIDETEFCAVCKSYGVDPSEGREAFKRLCVGDEVNREKFEKLWKEFFSSDDPKDPGNYIFGKVSF